MFSKPISLAITFIGVGALAYAVACSSDNSSTGTSGTSGSGGAAAGSTGGSGSTGSAGSSGDGGGGGTGSTGTTGSAGTTGSTGTIGSTEGGTTGTVLIDDMSSAGGAQIKLSPSAVGAPAGSIAGYWYTYNDGTGSQFPVPMTSFAYTTIGAAASTDGGSTISIPASDAGLSFTKAACTTGSDTKQYGYAAEGFNFATQAPADAGPDAVAPNPSPVTVNLSSFTGVQFWIYTDAGESIAVQFPDDNTDTLHGACLTADAGPCGNSFQAPQTTTPGSWTHVQVPFATLAQNLFFVPSYMTPNMMWDAQHVYSMAFQVSGPSMGADAGGTPVTYTLCVSDIELYH